MHADVLLGNKQAGWGWLLRKLGVAAVLYGACLACASALAAEPAMRFIAVILPAQSKSKAFKLAADSVKAGLNAAAKMHGSHQTYPLRVFDVDESEEATLAAFNQAQGQGAVAVIGPLTRSAVNYLADMADISVPVLALNSFDETTLRRANLYSFGLSIEAEVQQIVQLMRSQKVTAPVVIKAEGPLSSRMQRAFVEAWLAQAGRAVPVIEVRDASQQSREILAGLRGGDAVFFAADGRNASLIRPYVSANYLLYGTSQIATGRTVSVDLAGVHYVDMPWLANPDAPEHAAYRREQTLSGDEERLFAVGVDAWWLAQLLARGERFDAVDGLTGWLRPGQDGVIARELLEVVVTSTIVLPPEQTAASQPASVAP